MTLEIRLFPAAHARLDEIYDYTFETWGDAQADRYMRGFSDAFAAIARREILWRPVPAEFGDGWYARHEHHLIYWRLLPDGALGIVTILHERMHQLDRFREDAGEP